MAIHILASGHKHSDEDYISETSYYKVSMLNKIKPRNYEKRKSN